MNQYKVVLTIFKLETIKAVKKFKLDIVSDFEGKFGLRAISLNLRVNLIKFEGKFNYMPFINAEKINNL
jgi:hypothetical protein